MIKTYFCTSVIFLGLIGSAPLQAKVEDELYIESGVILPDEPIRVSSKHSSSLKTDNTTSRTIPTEIRVPSPNKYQTFLAKKENNASNKIDPQKDIIDSQQKELAALRQQLESEKTKNKYLTNQSVHSLDSQKEHQPISSTDSGANVNGASPIGTNPNIIVINPSPSIHHVKEYSLSDNTENTTECDLLSSLSDQFEPPTYDEVKKYPTELQRLIAMGNFACDYNDQNNNTDIQKMRPKAIEEAAYTIAIQTAVKWRYQHITTIIESIDDDLNEAYNFGPLLLYNKKLLPPVITKANSSFKLEDKDTAVSSSATYRIIQDAKIITKAPSWRDYIWKEFRAVEVVDKMLLPKNETEAIVWKEAIIDGWRQGMLQAHRLFAINLSRLERDFNGMITYMILEGQNIVSMPKLSEGEYAVKVSEGGKVLDVDQKIFRITKQIGFQDVNTWEAGASTIN